MSGVTDLASMVSLQHNYWRRKLAHRMARWSKTASSLADVPRGATVLLVSARHELAETQLYPFYYYRAILEQRYKLKFSEVSIDAVVRELGGGGSPTNTDVRRIFFQPTFEMSADVMRRALTVLKERFPKANIAFMDWFAPLHVRPASIVDEFIDIYVKKQVYRDYAQFSAPTRGDTNLNDYYARRYDLPDGQMQYSPPEGLDKKLRLGSNFGLSPQMLDLFLGPAPRMNGRDIDVHARIAVNGVPWYQAMRQEAKDAVDRLNGLKVASEGRVRRYQFFAEMMRSKLCFSPFGYGEICWRDYEAFATGALLLKPDVSHLEVLPDVFEPNETYVPLAWDLSDFEDKVKHYLADDKARNRICLQAFERMKKWIEDADYAKRLAELC